MNIEVILKISLAFATFLFTVLIPTVLFLIKNIKNFKAAKTSEEKEIAKNELTQLAQNFIMEAEAMYKNVDYIMKQNGNSCGAIKKDSVMVKIQQACATKGIEFDSDYWSGKIDEMVAMTKKVNSK